MSGPPRTRHSMNTILMNARIFDEDSSDDSDNSKPTSTKQSQFSFDEIKIKQEPEDVGEPFGIRKTKVKQELLENVKIENTKVKQEPRDMQIDEDTMFPTNIFDKLNLSKQAMEQYLSPVKLEVDDNTNSSMDSNSRKSAKRNVFTRESPYKTRQSPYKRPIDHESTQGISSRLQTQPGDNAKPIRKRKCVEMETDPVILRRRQKQIDYGKNTVGYDLYTKTVPKNERTQDDPQTPNKYSKYSRRGFDGLIKQWRLKLHKYDPPNESDV